MAKYKAYPEYKDSGVEWLGEIPRHWICTQVKYGYEITLGKMLQKNKSSPSDELKPYLKAQNIQPYGVDLNNVDLMWFSSEERSKLLLKPEDVLISEGGDVGRSAIWSGQLVECYIQNAINRARPIDNNSSVFLNYWIFYLKSIDFINTLCNKATIAHYTAEKLETSPLLLPKFDEQLCIASFLDHETAKIDNLIERQKQLIELLKEKRQAVIGHAVTKGLNPDAPMKDSGVEWLGEVPEHWRLKQIRHLCSFVGGGTPSKSNSAFWVGDIPWVSPKDMKIDYIFDAEDHISESAVKQSSTKLIPVNSVLIVVRGMILSHSFPVAINTAVVTINQDMKALIPNVKISFEYLHLVLKGFRQNVLDLTDNSSHGTKCLKTESFERMQIPLPPLQEQLRIVFDIKELLSKIDSLVSRQNEALTLLQERRTALISAAVTGKIDVRNWVAPEAREAEVSQEATA
ncbi:restriction endonuclease subunit S [Serratia plymuthica]|uniref:restriction endonuclease subunit S n=1 Tax=Serratia plymuthica TaxID=82996 RepID=UPI001BAFDBA2|nr:restriction endonuclease subunit S [Serratia plymuthica]QUY48916.1 restriction endonuclease subunit S [Serratia plymuthica]